MANETVQVTFEFRGDLDKEIEKVTLGVKGLRDESAKTYQRLIADSSAAYNAMSAESRKMAVSVQENINALRDLATVQQALDRELEAGVLTSEQYAKAKATLAIQENTLRQAISSGMQELDGRIRAEQQAVDSVIALQKRLQELTGAYYALSKADREGATGQGILKQIGEVDKEIQTAQNRLSTYSRTAGTGFNALSMSVQQVARELPALTMGANMFFLAISNNLPMLADNIRAARAEYEAMTKAGQAATPVWRQVLSSIVSWQTALVVGITVLSMYGKEIIAWAKSLVTGRQSLAETMETLDEFQESVAKTSSTTLTQLQKMSAEWEKLGNNIQAKEQYLLKNRTAFEGLGLSIGKVSDAENLFNQGKDAFVASVMARARAASALSLATEEYNKAILKQMEADRMPEETSYAVQGGMFGQTTWVSGKNMEKEKTQKEADELFKSAREIIEKSAEYSEEERKALEAANLKTIKNIEEGSVGAIKASIAAKEAELEQLTNKADYDKAIKEIEAEQKRLEAITGKKKSDLNKERQAREAANTIQAETAMRELEIKRQAETLAQKEKDAQLDLRAQKIALMDDGAEKELEQIRQNYDWQINEIEKKGREYVLAQQKIEQAAWENEHPDWKKQGLVFQPKTTGISQLPESQRRKITDATAIASASRDKGEADLLEKVLKQYQDYADKRLEIEKKYNEDIAFLNRRRTADNAEEIDKAVNEAGRLLKEQLSSLSMEELKDSGLWDKLFSDLDKMAISSLETLLKEAKEVNTSAWDDKNVKEYQDAIIRLEDIIHSRSPFKAIRDDWKALLESVKNGDKDGMASALSVIDGSVQSLTSNLNTISGSIEEVFGEEAGYAASQVSELTSALGGFASGAARIASGDILGGVTSVIGSIGKLFTMGKRVKEMNRQAREEQQQFYDEAKTGEIEYQRLLRERLRLQQQIGETTLSYNRRITEELHKQQQASSGEYDRLLAEIQGEQYISGVGYRHGTWFRKAKTWNEYSSLAGKSYEDIEKLYTEGKLGEKVSRLFEQLRALKEEGADINQMLEEQEEAMREAFTGTTANSVADSILQGFAEGRRSAKDFADDFQEMLNNAVLQGVKMRAMEEPLRRWYESFAVASQNGLTADSIASLRDEYNRVIEDAAKQLEDMEKVTGMTIGDLSGSRTAVEAKGIAAMSQDSADELNGNFYALLIYADKMSQGVTDIRTQLVEGISLLQRIAANTDRLETIEKDIRQMRSSMQDIVNRGLILRKTA